ncbi:hypothetical protein BDW66DRAFT_46347 [Aspergillus desertorum]
MKCNAAPDISTFSRKYHTLPASEPAKIAAPSCPWRGVDSEYTATADRPSLDLQFQEFQLPSPPLWSGKSIVSHPTLPRGSPALATVYSVYTHLFVSLSPSLVASALNSPCLTEPVREPLTFQCHPASLICPYRPWPVPTPQLGFIVSLAYGHASSTLLTAYPSYRILSLPFPVLHSLHSPYRYCCVLPLTPDFRPIIQLLRGSRSTGDLLKSGIRSQ